jgi:putative flippase GtrA
MGKRRVQQTRQVRQVRRVKPKAAPAAPPASAPQQRRQRERYVQSGGMLQGYLPELVVRIGRFAAAGGVLCLVAMALLLLLLPYGWPVRIVAAVVWVVPLAFGASFILPGVRLAFKDRKEEARMVQGQLVGASAVSTSIGLGMLMLKTRGGQEQYLVAPEKLAKVPGNQVTVMVSVTPNLRHVRSVGIMGQRLMPRPEPPIPAVVRRLRLLPIVTPIVLASAAIIGTDVVAFLPIYPDLLHAALALLVGAALAGAVYGASLLLQRRLYRDMESLMPGALG